MNLCHGGDMKGMVGRHREKADFIWAIADLPLWVHVWAIVLAVALLLV
jgi:hypothetical protein